MLNVKREFVTPELALKYLETTTTNRPINKDRVNQIVTSILRGQWHETHQSIAFNCDGSLKDGRHRLTAIVISETAVYLWVFRGLPDDAIPFIDIGKSRTISDSTFFEGNRVSPFEVAIGRMMMSGLSTKTYKGSTRIDTIEFIKRHMKAISYVSHRVSRGRLQNAALMAPVARAWYTRDHERLDEFIECLRTGIIDCPENSAAAALHKLLYVGSTNRKRDYVGGAGRELLYAKSSAALEKFLNYQPYTKIYAATEEPFPIPE